MTSAGDRLAASDGSSVRMIVMADADPQSARATLQPRRIELRRYVGRMVFIGGGCWVGGFERMKLDFGIPSLFFSKIEPASQCHSFDFDISSGVCASFEKAVKKHRRPAPSAPQFGKALFRRAADAYAAAMIFTRSCESAPFGSEPEVTSCTLVCRHAARAARSSACLYRCAWAAAIPSG